MNLNSKTELMKFPFLLILCLLALLQTGCSREVFCENMYHGLQKSDEMLHPPDEPAGLEKEERPRYDQYQQEREEITGRRQPDNSAP